MKKILAMILAILMVLSFAACAKEEPAPSSSAAAPASSSAGEVAADGEVSVTGAPLEEATLEFWYTNELHAPIFDFGTEQYNAAHPNAQITINKTLSANADMHNKMLIACQSGTGTPDVADINMNYYSNFAYGEVYLVDIGDIVELVIDDSVASRFELWSANGTYYGAPTHVGMMFNYYNMNVVEAAGLTIDDVNAIVTWDDFAEFGKKIVDKTGTPAWCIETTNQRPFWPILVSLGGDYITWDGEVTLDAPEAVEALEIMKKMWDDGIAVGCAGGNTSVEEFWTSMNKGDYAALTMPAWYMSRFISYMPDLKGRVAVRLMPVAKEGDPAGVGIGGTATSILKFTKNVEEAKEWLYFSKLTKEANVNIWNTTQFDPVRVDSWTEPDLTSTDNEIAEYFYGESVFTLLSDYVAAGNEIISPSNTEWAAQAQNVVMNSVMPAVFNDGKDIQETLTAAAKELRDQM